MAAGFRLKGTSMLPLFREGDIVLVENRAENIRIGKGDCVVYEFRGRKLLHRVVKVAREGVLLRDDGCILPFHFAAGNDIVGKVISRNPLKKGFLGYLYFRIKNFLA